MSKEKTVKEIDVESLDAELAAARKLEEEHGLSDVADRHGLVAVPGKQAERRGQNPLLRIIHTMPLLLKKKTIVYNQYSKRSFTCQA